MSKRSKRQTGNVVRTSSQRASVARTPSQIEAYLLSREILRRIRRTSTLFSEVASERLALRDRLH